MTGSFVYAQKAHAPVAQGIELRIPNPCKSQVRFLSGALFLSLSCPFPLPFLSLSSPFPVPFLSLSSPFPLCPVFPLPFLSLSSPFPLPFLSLSSPFPLPFLSLSSPLPLPFLSVFSVFSSSVFSVFSVFSVDNFCPKSLTTRSHRRTPKDGHLPKAPWLRRDTTQIP